MTISIPALFAILSLSLLSPLSAAEDRPEPLTSWQYPPEMPGARVEVYREVGDAKLNAWIFEPAGHAATDRRPAVVFFFGGGWKGGSPGQFLPQCLHLAERGMVAISCDYRVNSRHGVMPQDCVEDAKAAISWVRANANRLGVDPERIVASGGSAGGHLAAATALVPGYDGGNNAAASSMPNALVLFNPAVVLAPVEGQPELVSEEKFAGLQDRTGGQARTISPYHFVRGGLPPSLILHGTEDEAVPFGTVKLFQQAMAAAGNRCELKAYEGQPHGFFNPGRGSGEARLEASRNYYRTLADVDAFLVALGYLKPVASTPKPNILLIVSDDQGYGDFSIHGNRHLQTPHIDELAATGVRFDRFYVNSFCAPTRAALLTGRWPLRTGCHGVTHNREAMKSEEVTLAEALRGAGYRSACIGKWHNGEQFPFTPQGQGFDESFGFNNGHWNNYFDATLWRGAKLEQTKGYITDVLTDEAMAFIQANQAQPFFCYVSYNAPHSPYQVPDNYFEKFKAKGLDDTAAAFYGMCENQDDNVGRLLAHLDSLQLSNDTIVLYLTDNGGTAGVKIYNAGMRGGKTSVHEGGTRVPLFMRWPAAKWKPQVVETIVSHIDLYPTLLDLCGVTAPSGPAVDGLSLRPFLEGKADDWPERTLFTHNPINESNKFQGRCARSSIVWFGRSPVPRVVPRPRPRTIRRRHGSSMI